MYYQVRCVDLQQEGILLYCTKQELGTLLFEKTRMKISLQQRILNADDGKVTSNEVVFFREDEVLMG